VQCENNLFQAVRLVDVFLLGPVMIRASRNLPGAAGSFLAIAGIATIIFNGVTFLDIASRR